MGLAALDLQPLEGLSLSELIGRFPKPPTVLPAGPPAAADVAGAARKGSAEQAPVAPVAKLPLARKVEESSSMLLREDSEEVAERDYEDLLRRASKGVIGTKEQALLFRHLLKLPTAEMTALQAKVQDALGKNPMLKGKSPSLFDMMARDKGPPVIEVSKYCLDFDKKVAPIGGELTDRVSLTVKSGKAQFNVVLPPKDLRYDLRVLPSSGKIKNGKPPKEDLFFSIVCKTTVHAQAVVIVEIEGGNRHFLTVDVQSEPSQFGMPLEEMEMCENAVFEGFPHRVPALLAKLRGFLTAGEANLEEGIFRVAGDETETANAKAKINKGTFTGTQDVHAIANLIKIWFRELPVPVLNDLPPEFILSADSEEKCVAEFERLREPNRSLVLWLLDLMCDVALHEDSNRMNARSLSIVIGPNLYHSPESAQLSALESLRLSQQTVSFVFHILSHRLRFHKERLQQ